MSGIEITRERERAWADHVIDSASERDLYLCVKRVLDVYNSPWIGVNEVYKALEGLDRQIAAYESTKQGW